MPVYRSSSSLCQKGDACDGIANQQLMEHVQFSHVTIQVCTEYNGDCSSITLTEDILTTTITTKQLNYLFWTSVCRPSNNFWVGGCLSDWVHAESERNMNEMHSKSSHMTVMSWHQCRHLVCDLECDNDALTSLCYVCIALTSLCYVLNALTSLCYLVILQPAYVMFVIL